MKILSGNYITLTWITLLGSVDLTAGCMTMETGTESAYWKDNYFHLAVF